MYWVIIFLFVHISLKAHAVIQYFWAELNKGLLPLAHILIPTDVLLMLYLGKFVVCNKMQLPSLLSMLN